MDQWQKDRIRDNYTALVDGIENIDTILSHLYQERVFSDNVVRKIKREKDEKEQNRMLLGHIQKRPPGDYDKFVYILYLAENEHLADRLMPGVSSEYNCGGALRPRPQKSSPLHDVDNKPGSGGSSGGSSGAGAQMRPGSSEASLGRPIQSQNDENSDDDSILAKGEVWYEYEEPPYKLPEVWPDENRWAQRVKVRTVSSASMRTKFQELKTSAQSETMYSMTGPSRAVIVSNRIFHDSQWNRYGNEQDEHKIKSLLEQLNFSVEVWPDKTEEELLYLMDREARCGSNHFHSFVMVVLTHGQKDKIMAADCNYVEVRKIMDFFDAQYSRRFAGKPKMFFIQACQGQDKDNGTMPTTRIAEINERFNGIRLDDDETRGGDVTDSGLVPRTTEKFARYSDMIMAMATVPGFVAWRNERHGTWFIQAVIEIFANCACDEDLSSMLTKVNNLVSRGRSQEGGHVQISNVCHNTLRRAVYFFPGMY